MFGQQFGFSTGAVPDQQARLAALQQYQMQQQMQYPPQLMPTPIAQPGIPNPMPIQGRMVASIEEAKVAQVPVDGSNYYLPCPSVHKIFVKSMDLNGNAIFESYVRENDTEQNPCYAEASALEQLKARVVELEKKLKGADENV